jgi:hypothetical protein
MRNLLDLCASGINLFLAEPLLHAMAHSLRTPR